METYTVLREFADSWFLIALFAFFLGTIAFAFWPSLTPERDEAAAIPMRDDATKCAGTCTACTSNSEFLEGAEHG